MDQFVQPSFSGVVFAEAVFRQCSEDQVKEKLNDLQRLAKSAESALQKTVMENYKEFIGLSHNISEMESDLFSLRTVVSKLSSDVNDLSELQLSLNMEAYTFAGNVSSSSNNNSISAGGNRNPQQGPASVVEDALQLEKFEEQLDELEVYIQERDYGGAVNVVELLTSHIAEAGGSEELPEVSDCLSRLKQRMVQLLTLDLKNPLLHKKDVRAAVDYLMKLGSGEHGANLFLEGRTAQMGKEVRSLKFHGDITRYITELSHVVFASLLHTCSDFVQVFSNHQLMSAVTVWVKKQLDEYIETFRRQVFLSGSENFAVMSECIAVAQMNCDLLEEVGMNFNFYMMHKFQPYVVRAVKSYYDRVQQELVRYLQEETWSAADIVVQQPHNNNNNNTTTTTTTTAAATPAHPHPHPHPHPYTTNNLSGSDLLLKNASSALHHAAAMNKTVRVTKSAERMYTVTQQLLARIHPIVSLELYEVIVGGMVTLFQSYFKRLSSLLNSLRNNLNEDQNLNAIASTKYLLSDLLPRIQRVFQRVFRKPIREIQHLLSKMDAIPVALMDAFSASLASTHCVKTLKWGTLNYTSQVLEDETRLWVASPPFVHLVLYLDQLKTYVEESLGPSMVNAVISRFLEELVATLSDDVGFWDRTEPPLFSKGGLQQFVLDFKFLLQAAGSYASEEVTDGINDLIERGIVSYCKSSKSSYKNVLQSQAWFDEKIRQSLRTVVASTNRASTTGIGISSSSSTAIRPTSIPVPNRTTIAPPQPQ